MEKCSNSPGAERGGGKKKSVLFFPSQILPMSPLISCLFLETLKLKQGEKKRKKGTEKGHEQE